MKRVRRTILIFTAAVSIFWLSACTTMVAEIKKADGYNAKINDVLVSWVAAPNLITKVTARYAVTQDDQEKSSIGITQISRLLASLSGQKLAGKLRERAVNVVENDQPKSAKVIVRLEPKMGFSDCTILGCVHDMAVEVNVIDVALKKTVWTGGFKVGAPFGATLDDKTVDDFVQTIITQMTRSQLL